LVRIRKAEKGDLPKMIDVFMRAYEGLEEYGEPSRGAARRYIKWLMRRSPEGTFVVEEDGRIIGFVCADPEWEIAESSRGGAIHEIVVDPGYRGRGIGRMLMEHAENYLRSKGVDVVELWVGRDNPARFFYEKLGYQEKGLYGKWRRMIKFLK